MVETMGSLEPIGGILQAGIPKPQRNNYALGSDDGPDIVDGFTCATCHDAGFVYPMRDGKPDYTRVVPCPSPECREKADADRRQRYLKMCQLPDGSETKTIESFRVSPGVKEAYDAAVSLANDDGTVKWLTLTGRVDHGKTHLLIAICRRWLERGMAARYAFVPLLLDELRAGFELKGEHSYKAQFDFFCKVPLLALDDLGTESTTPWVQEKLDTIIDYRYVNNLPLIVTTNRPLSSDDPRVPVVSERIASRLKRFRPGRVVVLGGPEYRLRRVK